MHFKYDKIRTLKYSNSRKNNFEEFIHCNDKLSLKSTQFRVRDWRIFSRFEMPGVIIIGSN